MRVLFVINNLYTKGNGLSSSVRRTIAALRARGVDVRVLSAGRSDTGERPEYQLADARIPIFSPLIEAQGYKFARADRRVIANAVQWADVIHLEEPFAVEIAVCRAAKHYGKPCVATYHLHPENLFASVGLEKSRWCNGMTMRVWRDTVYNHCQIVQCPTENVRRRLEAWRYKAQLRVISNGILPVENGATLQRKRSKTGTVHIISVGRLSREKDQDTLLDAMRYVRNADRVQLHFAGQGPTKRHLTAKANALYRKGILRRKPTFGFYNQEQLQRLFSIADLYIHSAGVEVEGMSCMEAIRTGIVPIIAKGSLTATAQFALDARSTYPVGDARALARRIDYWIEHEKERHLEARKYLGIEEQYSFEDTITEIIDIYSNCM